MSNEYEHRREAIRQRVSLGFVERIGQGIETQAPAEATMSGTLLANWRLAYASGDLQSANGTRRLYELVVEFENALIATNNYASGGMDQAAYTDYMRDVYVYALQQGYVNEREAYREWLYYGKG